MSASPGPVHGLVRGPCRDPLILTGGPAAGKSVTSRAVAQGRPRCAVVEVDDVRQLVVSGAAAPWEGTSGLDQQRLGAVNACCLARNFIAAGIDVIIADVATPETIQIYRRGLPGCRVVHLQVSWPEAQRRAASRTKWLTEEEFRMLHAADQSSPPHADYRVVVDGLTAQEQAQVVERLWAEPPHGLPVG